METKYIHKESVHNTQAAEVIVPIVMKLLKPASVLDVGCGIGTWLHVFANNDVGITKGIDGDYVDQSLLHKYLPAADFIPRDLSKPFDIGQKFDIVMSLEVAEHLPESSAEGFVKSLVAHGDTVLFSAAIPGAGGQNHINEQWQSYWAEKFKRHGYKVYDAFRPLIWNEKDVEMWYRQNMLLFSKKHLPFPEAQIIDMIIPEFWNHHENRLRSVTQQLQRIKDGKVGAGFYLKGLMRSLRFFGKKVD
jgi:SAM-dependent methyltransferase